MFDSDFPAQIQELIGLMDSHDGETALVKINDLVAGIEKMIGAMERRNPPEVADLNVSLTPPDRVLRLLAARLRAAASEIEHTHFMQAKERLEAALHAQLTGEELQESSTA